MPYYKGVLDNFITQGHTKDAQEVAARLLSLRNRLQKQLPARNVLSSVLLATWNIRELGADEKFGTRLDESLLYIAEIISGGIRSVGHGHVEAARALGLSPIEVQLWIVLPQAFFNMLPALAGRYVVAIKNTSLAAVIGFIELTREGQLTTAATYRPFTVYIAVATIYFAICFPLTQWSRRLERTLRVAR